MDTTELRGGLGSWNMRVICLYLGPTVLEGFRDALSSNCRPDALSHSLSGLPRSLIKMVPPSLKMPPLPLYSFATPFTPGTNNMSDFPSVTLEAQCCFASWSGDGEKDVSFLTTHPWCLLWSSRSQSSVG